MKGQYIRLTQELLDEITRLHNEGKGAKKISDELGLVKSSTNKWIRLYIKEGKPFVEKEERNHEKTIIHSGKIEMNDEPVKATLTLCKTCIYGRAQATTDSDKCNFAGCTGRTKTAMQPNKVHTPTMNKNYTECYFYQKATRENPRRKIKFGSNV